MRHPGAGQSVDPGRARTEPPPATGAGRGHRCRRSFGVLALAAVGALLLAACGSGTTSPSATKSPKPVVKGTPIKGGVASYSLAVGNDFSWMLPLENTANYEPWDFNVEDGMWRPLYFAGGPRTGIDYGLSIGQKPVYSHGNTQVTVTLNKGWTWSNGAPVTSANVRFFFQLEAAGAKAGKYAPYLPGLMPDDIASVSYPSAYQFVIHLKRAYNPTWFTGNQLTWIYPLPVQAWDRTSATGPAGTAASTPAGAKQVFSFLFSQSKQRSTYSTNPLWKTVDGPFVVSSYNTATHAATFNTNPSYTGPTKPRIAGYKVFSFTTGSAELNALRSGGITFGYVPFGDLKQSSYFKSHGYTIKGWPVFYNQVVELGYTSKTWGPLVKQLYIRQALQRLITQSLYIKRAFGGYALPDYGPVANYPGSPYVSPGIKTNPYPYDPQAAAKLLTQHGWAKGPGGIDVCKRPGTGPSECGKGIPKGKKLSLLLMYSTGTTASLAAVSAFHTVAKSVGVDIAMDGQSTTTMFSIGGVCPSTPPCKWGLINYAGYMWTYGQYQLIPSGTSQWGKGNYWGGGYYSVKAQKLIDAVETSTTSSLKPLYKAENYLSKDLASLWWPLTDLAVVAVKNNLQGWQQLSPYGAMNPQTWYVKK